MQWKSVQDAVRAKVEGEVNAGEGVQLPSREAGNEAGRKGDRGKGL